MSMKDLSSHLNPRTAHTWLQKARLAYAPGPTTPVLDAFAAGLLDAFRQAGHTVLPEPEGELDLLLTTAGYGEPLNWREALMFTARRRFRLAYRPVIFTLIHATPEQLKQTLAHFERVLPNEPPDPADYRFPGLSDEAFHTLIEQGRRGGPILSLVRLLQSQALCIRIILVVGSEKPEAAYTFDLVGAHPRTEADDPKSFYEDLMLRLLTAISTHEITEHELLSEPVPLSLWQKISTPSAMKQAGLELGQRNFFTEMVQVGKLVKVPVVDAALANQYSEGCFATWEPALDALVVTVTGSARPVEKARLTDDDLSVIVGLRADGKGARVRPVEGTRNDPPSSEAVELIETDLILPHHQLGGEWQALAGAVVPAARSKLHGHRGVKSYDPQQVEHVWLDREYYHYPVSCSTDAQARAITTAFGRSQALLNTMDSRQIVFTVLPGHGVVIMEKWMAGKQPFQLIWEAMDSGALEIDNLIPQGPFIFLPGSDGRMALS